MFSKAYFADAMHFIDEIKIGTLPLNHITQALTVTEQPQARNGGIGALQLQPVGYPVPQSRALTACE